jgi:hypothetical protein
MLHLLRSWLDWASARRIARHACPDLQFTRPPVLPACINPAYPAAPDAASPTECRINWQSMRHDFDPWWWRASTRVRYLLAHAEFHASLAEADGGEWMRDPALHRRIVVVLGLGGESRASRDACAVLVGMALHAARDFDVHPTDMPQCIGSYLYPGMVLLRLTT